MTGIPNEVSGGQYGPGISQNHSRLLFDDLTSGASGASVSSRADDSWASPESLCSLHSQSGGIGVIELSNEYRTELEFFGTSGIVGAQVEVYGVKFVKQSASGSKGGVLIPTFLADLDMTAASTATVPSGLHGSASTVNWIDSVTADSEAASGDGVISLAGSAGEFPARVLMNTDGFLYLLLDLPQGINVLWRQL